MVKKVETKKECTHVEIDRKFVCEKCLFESKNAKDVWQHEFLKHEMKAEYYIKGTRFIFLETETDFANLIEKGLYGIYFEDCCYGKFKYPGWYGLKETTLYNASYDDNDPIVCIIPLSDFISEWNKELCGIQECLTESANLIKNNPKLNK